MEHVREGRADALAGGLIAPARFASNEHCCIAPMQVHLGWAERPGYGACSRRKLLKLQSADASPGPAPSASTLMSEPFCWVLTTEEAGARSQALGLAEAVGLPIVEKTVGLSALWSWLPGVVPLPVTALHRAGDRLEPPWPDMLIACGRRAIAPALAVKRLSNGRTLAVYVQDPGLARRQFDLVAAPEHDGISGANVIATPTALHRVTADKLAPGAAEWRCRLPSPLIGVLLGGDSAKYRLTSAVLDQLAAVLRQAHRERGYNAYVSPSRRTGESVERALRDALRDEPWATIWDGTGDNPLFGMLALADRLIVTGESVSMISECLATGHPVHVMQLEGSGRRHERFLGGLMARGLVSLVEGGELDWRHAGQGPINATAEVAERVRAMLHSRRAAGR